MTKYFWPVAGFTIAAMVSMAQEAKTVTGTATYRERIALPPDAVFEATLEDVSRAGARAQVIGRTTIEKPGQPPFKFSIEYDPVRIVERNTYSVRARVTTRNGALMFTTDQAYPVLTQGKGREVTMVMRRASSSSGETTGSALGALPASFRGDLPCADCPGIRHQLNLFPDKAFYLRITYLGRDLKPIDDVGRWDLSGSTLTLHSGKEQPQRFAVKSSDLLQKLDLQGRPIKSALNYDLRRDPAFERIEPRAKLRGMFRYMADAPTFTDCQSGQRWPVAMEGSYRALEAAYMQTKRQPAEELLVTLEGQVAMRPNADGGRPTPTLVVERYTGIWPGETCGAPLSTSSLRDTYWKLTRLGDKPVILAEKQREPHLVFRTENSRVTGFSGCNNMSGGYKSDGNAMTLTGLVSTQMACVQGMETEAAFLKGLESVSTWKISGQHLELYDASGAMLARLEARALR